jgi:hemoglobin-like flavoprotein
MAADDVYYDQRRQMLRLSALSLSNRLAIGNLVNGGFPRDLRGATYLTPEQYRGEPYTHLTDQYALALLAVEMLLGQPPVVVKRAADLEEKKRFFDDPSRWRDQLASLHPTFADQLLRMLSSDPARRFDNMATLALEIEQLEPAARALVAQSYLERCMNRPEFYREFYVRFFARCSRAEEMFRDLDLERQYGMLDQALQVLLNFVPSNRIEAKKLGAIAAAHGRWSVTAAELEQFCAALVDTLRDVGREPPAVLAAWQAVLQPGVDLLRQRMVREGSA